MATMVKGVRTDGAAAWYRADAIDGIEPSPADGAVTRILFAGGEHVDVDTPAGMVAAQVNEGAP